MATLGYTSAGGSTTGSNASVGSKFVATEDGTITAINVYVASPQTETVRAAVYANAAGSPAAKLAESSGAVSIASGWVSIPTSYAFTSGTTLWLMYWKGGVAGSTIAYATPGDVANQTAYYSGGTFPTWPDPFNEDAFLDWKVSIYADYTPAGGIFTPFFYRQHIARQN